VEFPRITVVAHSGDLSPRLMQLSVTRPLEEAARGALGVRRVRSKTIRGGAELSVLFDPDADMRYALQLLQGKVDEVRSELPAGTTVIVERMTPAIFPILSVNVTGRVPAVDLRDVAQFQLRPLLTRIPGVSRVEVVASEEREVSVLVDPARLAAARLSLPALADALRSTNEVTSVGRLPKDYRQYLVLSTAELKTLDDVRRVVVAFRNGAPLMSLGGLAIAIGLVIDDAIVVVENIHRHLAGGQPAPEAARAATGELVAAVVGSTLTTVVVFVPLGLLEGVVGQFFAALSVTLSAAVLLSLVVALLFVPSVAARVLGSRDRRPAGLDRLTRLYERLLRAALARPWPVIAATVGVAALGVLGYTRLDTGFLPEVDEGGYVIDYWTPPGTSLPETDRMVRQVEAIVRETPEVAGFARRTGTELGVFATAQNSGDILVRLKPRARRSRDAQEIIVEQRERFARELPGVTIEFVQLLQDMLGDLEGNAEPIEVKFFGDDLATLTMLADDAAGRMSRIPGIVDIVGPRTGNPELEVQVDPVRAAKAGFTVEQVSSQLAAGLIGESATSFRRGDRLVDIRVRLPDRFRFDAAWIREYPLSASSGLVVPLSAVADVRAVEGVSELYREDLKQMVPVTARLEKRDLGSAVADLIDYVDRAETGGDVDAALIRAGTTRLRPILMTTLCTLFGLLPLSLGLGAGAELQKPLAIAVIGGLTVSTAITLIFVPTLTSVIRKRQQVRGRP